VSLSAHARIIGASSRTTLAQTFTNPSADKAIPELRYAFPLYDGVSVVGFVCIINKDRVIRGIVQERAQARKTFDDAVAKGATAGLLEQLPDASDVFTTAIGNVPAGAEIKVEITYLGELKHDAEADGIRFTIPTTIAPRYGNYPGQLINAATTVISSGIDIVVDAEVPTGSSIKSVQSPSHPISVTIGNTSTGAAAGEDMSLQKASATLSLGTVELDKDFILHLVPTNTANPVALLETHPTIPDQKALMATLVPKFNLPSSRPEIVFVCDRSGSMNGGKIQNLAAALQIFLKSLPLGVKFNICSFGSRHEFLFQDGSRSYDASSLKEATSYVDSFTANFGGTEIYNPLEETFKKRYNDMDLEVFLLTDGEVWDQGRLFTMINKYVSESQGSVRLFTLGIGQYASHSLIEGVARAGNGFSQLVGEDEKMNSKVVRMLKAALTPHVKDYTLEIKYEAADDEEFELVEKVVDALVLDVSKLEVEPEVYHPASTVPMKPISLFDNTVDPDVEMIDSSLDHSSGGKYAHVPAVAVPKLLQAPFVIPPLFPFSRTTVYILLSGQSAQRTPKSVVLRGTSIHGLLELEIPVTALQEPGETIHQLAARKAVKELEEGRGWLYHTKDASTVDGQLLKDKYQGRFSDMVEREAVRMGVLFQVGGKWCSFVAVDEEKDEEREVAQSVAQPESLADKNRQFRAQMAQQMAQQMPMMQQRTMMHTGQQQQMQINQRQQQAQMAQHSMPPVTQGALLSVTSPFASSSYSRSTVRNRDNRGHDNFRSYPRMEVAPIAPPVPLVSGSVASPFGASAFERSGFPVPGAMGSFGSQTPTASNAPPQPPVQKQLASKAARKSAPGPSRFESLSFYTESNSDARERDEPSHYVLEALVRQQTFTGSWDWNGDLHREVFDQQSGQAGNRTEGSLSEFLASKLVALEKLLLSGRCAQAQSLAQPGPLLATALVLAFLQSKFADRKDEWEMLAEKAEDWLRDEMTQVVGDGKISVEEYVEEVKTVLLS